MHDPLAAIPLRPPDVEVRQDSRGCLHLRRWAPVNRLQRLLRQQYATQVELDEFGSLFYQQVDGRQTLRDIIETIVRASGKPRRDVEQGAVLFTKQLMTKNLLQLKIPA